jgi:hypothetical protein
MAIVFSATLVRVVVTQETLETIADLLNIPKADRSRILKGGVFIAAPAAVGGGGGSGARAASRARGARGSAAGGTAARTTSSTTRPRK